MDLRGGESVSELVSGEMTIDEPPEWIGVVAELSPVVVPPGDVPPKKAEVSV
jgi:hypothetical protein